eukprot:jgi/Ulvmu1/4672/UM002_0403.1
MAKVRKKKRTHQPEGDSKQKHPPPKSFVFAFGKNRALLKSLQNDVRQVMQPFTAAEMRVSRNNVLKDFVHVAGPLGVTHMIVLTATDKASYMKLCKSPRGPTAVLQIMSYSLARDVQVAQSRPRSPQAAFLTPPLVVLNGFSGDQHLQLTGVLFQNMFPSINVNTTKLNKCQRIVLLSHNKATDTVSMRHYCISLAPAGLTKGIKALVTSKAAPDLSQFSSVADFVERAGYASDSDADDAAQVTAPQTSRGQASRVRLHEIGPRLELQVVKIHEGLASGRVLFHRFEQRTADETAAQQEGAEARERLRGERRREQEENVRRKAAEARREQLAKEAQKVAKGAAKGKGKGDKALSSAIRVGEKQWWHDVSGAAHGPDDNDAYYLAEVGQAPDEEQGKGSKRTRGDNRTQVPSRKTINQRHQRARQSKE